MIRIHNIEVEERDNLTIVTLSTNDNEKVVMAKDGDEWIFGDDYKDVRRFIPIVNSFLEQRLR